MDLIDLHTHSNASDGSLSPAELVELAKAEGLLALAITDHDTVDGVDQALAAGERLGVKVIPGVELSVAGGPRGSMHVVGLFLDHRHPELALGLARVKKARAERNPKMAALLNDLGIDLTMEEVAAHSGGGQVGRPHFAQALVQRGVVKNPQEAFVRFLGAGKPAYVPKEKLASAEGIELINRAGGLAILAHPGLLKLGINQMEALLKELAGQGLAGLEAWYSEHDPVLAKRLAALAARLGLAVSGGTDFHGAGKPAIRLGVGRGALRVGEEVLTELQRRLRAARARAGGANGE